MGDLPSFEQFGQESLWCLAQDKQLGFIVQSLNGRREISLTVKSTGRIHKLGSIVKEVELIGRSAILTGTASDWAQHGHDRRNVDPSTRLGTCTRALGPRQHAAQGSHEVVGPCETSISLLGLRP